MVEQQPDSSTPKNEASANSTDDASRQSEALHKQHIVETSLKELIESLAADRRQPGFDLVAESYLMRLGIHENLLAAGILPSADPNPYDPDQEPVLYAQWWNEHTELDPWQAEERYHETLTHLYIGARLGFLAGRLLNRVPIQRIDDNI